MKIRKRVTAAAVAGITSVGVALAGIGLVAPAEAAQAKAPVLTETDYGLQGTAYGVRAVSSVGAQIGRTPFSYLSCTRLVGRKDHEALASVQAPADSPYIQASSLDSSARTYRDKAHGVDAAVTGITKIGTVQLGDSTTPRLTIQDLRTQSIAWATNGGKLKTSNKISSGSITIDGVSGPGTGTPLDQLIDAANGGINDVIAALDAVKGNQIEIPGLGMVSMGYDRQVRTTNWAFAGSFVLRVKLYGPDQKPGGGDNTEVGIGRSWAKITRDLPAGVMGGRGYGANAEVAGGVVNVGELGEQPLSCRGTDGKVRTSPTAALDVASAGQLVASGIQGQAYGLQHDSGAAEAWTDGSVANLTLGPLELRGVVGRANVKQGRSGKIIAQNIKGSSIGEILLNGKSQGALDPKTAKDFPPIDIPGVASIDFFVKHKTHRGMTVSAVVIKMLPDTPGPSEVDLGNARVHINRY